MDDKRRYRVCHLCAEVVPLDAVFAYADERMLVCRVCTTPVIWSALSEPSDNRDEGIARS